MSDANRWRLILDSARPATENMALDSALMQTCVLPTLRLYSWNPRAVSIGRFQSAKDEVDLEYAESHGIDVVRRLTGGGAVFHDKEVTYMICAPEDNPSIPRGLHESYQSICGAVITGLSELGLRAEYRPLNDITINGKKVSGCAQTRRGGKILQHGTLILDVDVEEMFTVLRVPHEKNVGRMPKGVTSISVELGRRASEDAVQGALVAGFEKHFGIAFSHEAVSPDELTSMKSIAKETFTREWLLQR